MRSLRLFIICVLFVTAAAVHSATPIVLTHQGRLLDGTDQPVSGAQTLVFRIYDSETSGTQLWTETRDITCTDGLYSTSLGTVASLDDVFDGNERWLEISVGGVTLTPRLRLSAAPAAATTVQLSSSRHTPFHNFGAVVRTTDNRSENYLDCDDDNDGVADYAVHWEVDATGPAIRLTTDTDADGVNERQFTVDAQGPTISCVMSYSPPNGIIDVTKGEVCDDGGTYDEMVVHQGGTTVAITDSCTPSGALRAITTKGVPPSPKSVKSLATPAKASVSLESDVDNDGVRDIWHDEDCDDDGYARTTSSSGGNSVITDSVDLLGARMAINRKGPPGQHRSMSADCDDASSGLSIENLGSSGQDNVGSLRAYPDSTVFDMGSHTSSSQEITYRAKAGSTGATKRMAYIDPGTGSSNEIDDDCDGIEARMAINSKWPSKHKRSSSTASQGSARMAVENIGSSGNDGVSMDCDDASSSLTCVRLNGLPPGEPVIGTLHFSSELDQSSISMGDVSGDGRTDLVCGRDSIVEERVMRGNGDVVVLYKATQGKSGKAKQSLRVINPGTTDTTGTDEDCDGDEASYSLRHSGGGGGAGGMLRAVSSHVATTGSSIAIDEPGVQVAIACKDEGSGTYTGSFRITASGAQMASMSSNGECFVKNSLGVDVASPTHPIEHSSGAHLTVGGDWINASDENLKENFRSVDGKELLEKIEELEIKEWNYKNQGDDIKHIGPTAQEFKETFGLGENDKSISTIDPSGIALAAIKQLKKENDELKKQMKKQNDDLSAQVEELTKLVKQLSSSK